MTTKMDLSYLLSAPSPTSLSPQKLPTSPTSASSRCTPLPFPVPIPISAAHPPFSITLPPLNQLSLPSAHSLPPTPSLQVSLPSPTPSLPSLPTDVVPVADGRISRPRGSRPRPHTCWCGKRFSKREHLRRHDLLVHLAYRPFRCHLCAVDFGTKQNMQVHFGTKKHRDRAMYRGYLI